MLTWATEADLRGALAQIWDARTEAALALAQRVHTAQVRHDGTPYLEEHIYPVSLSVGAYLSEQGAAVDETRTAVCAALLHDALEDWGQATPPFVSAAEAFAAVGRVAGVEVLALVEALTKPDRREVEGAQRQARYRASLHEAPWTAHVVKVFDRLNNLACVHKRPPAKVREYIAESADDYLPLAAAVDPTLAEQMRQRLAELDLILLGLNDERGV